MKVLMFDLEIEKVVPFGGDLHQHHPLGISVAATLADDDNGSTSLQLWYGQGRPDGKPWPKMPQAQVQVLVRYLQRMVGEGGYTLVTWNGLSFDFRVMAVESNMLEECVALATGQHMDLMFQFFCHFGYAIGMQACANGFGVEGKTEGMDGAKAPVLWAAGQYDQVMEYVSQDVRTLMDIYQNLRDRGTYEWEDRLGRYHNAHIPGGRLLTVSECLALPPATPPHWIHNPWPLSQFTKWMKGAL